MSVENEPIIPVQVKYVELQSATVLRNEKIPFPPSRETEKPQQKQNGQATLVQNGVCQSPLSPENIEVTDRSPVMTPGSPTNPLIPNKFQFDPNLTYAEKVAHEMIVTEKIYLDNLKQIIDGFLGPVVKEPELDVSQKNIDDLFINVEEIYQFNWVLLQDMEKCNFDPVKLAECFVVKQIGFNVYTKYCTNYPRSMEVLLDWNQREDTANFIKRQQESLGHTLPLCSFLLKPVQRILKYHLLLGNIAKHFKKSEDEEGYEIIQKALSAMTNVAKHINDMKRKHEDAVHLQEIQSVLLDYEGPNLNSFGSIVLEDTFRLHGTKTGRYLFLFEKALLITKRRSDGTFSWKATVMYSNMMLADSVFREPLTFQVIPFDDRKICYTFVARNLDTKDAWLLELKERLIDSYTAAVPMKAKQIILGKGREDNEKENAEPDSTRSSNAQKGANQQRQSTKDNFSQTTKSSKNADSERRKYKDTDESIEEKMKTPIDSFKSPLRRKLRVFKKRKFNSKDLGKSSKRVSWSSDDNNDESYSNKERLNIKKKNQNKERKVSVDSEPYDVSDVKQNNGDNKYDAKNDSEVSISSLLRDGKTMESVAGEEHNNLSDHVKLRANQGDISPSKKRKLAREKRHKCKSMPAGQFPVIDEHGEFLTIDKNEPKLNRTHSLSRLYEKFLETQLIGTPTSVKELQKYGLVNAVRENNRKSKRLGSYDEELASEEGFIHRSSDLGNVIPTQVDDVIHETGQSVHHTMKRVSMAFSDISPTFSPEKSPSTSIEDITTEDITEDLTTGDLTTEDLTTGDLSLDEYAGGDLTPEDSNPDDLSPEDDTIGYLPTEKVTSGDLNLDECGTGNLVPDETLGEGKSYVRRNLNENKYKEQDGNAVLKPKRKESLKNGVAKDYNGNDRTENAYEENSIYEDQSTQDRISSFHSEASSYVDTLSDESCDEEYDQPWASSISSSYQRVFSLKRSYSEENLVSKYSLDDASSEDHSSNVTSKSYTHFDRTPVMRSKSADCSKRSQGLAQPFTFSVTPRKKIVIKDSLWETIKENRGTNNHEIFVANDVHALRRRRRRKSGHKKRKKNRTLPGDERIEKSQCTVRTCAALNMTDHRKTKNNKSGKNSAANSTESRDEKIRPTKNSEESMTEYNCGSLSSNKPEKTGYNNKTVRSHSEKNFNTNNGNMMSNSQEKTDSITDNAVSERVENTEENDRPVVTKIAVALKKKNHKPSREKSLVRVDKNVSELPATINYLCIETFPSDESPSTEQGPETSACDVKRTNRRNASKVERLSKYFNNFTTEYSKDNSKYDMYKHAESLRKGCSIKKRVEELSKNDMHTGKFRRSSEEKLTVDEELDSFQNIQDGIGVLRRSTSDENQSMAKSRIEFTSSLNQDIPNVQKLRSKIEEVDSSLKESEKTSDNNGTSKKVATSLRIKGRIQDLGENPDKKPDKNVDDDLRTFKRLKERIERLQKNAERTGVDSERDITISDENDSNHSPRQNEELRTVVIKRGWVQQFIQRIETGS